MKNIKDTAKFYKKHNYVVIKNFISKELANFIYEYGKIRAIRAAYMAQWKYPGYNKDTDGAYGDGQVDGTYSCYADPVMETLLSKALTGMREITGLNLAPTYSYWRLYKKGDELKRHKDRPSCEVSTTLCIGYDNSNLKDKKENWEKYNWPMWVDESCGEDNKGVPIYMEPGDMIVYRGTIVEHWREKLLGNLHAQVFMHYNDVDGPFKDTCILDARPALGLPPAFKNEEKLKKMDEIDVELINKRAQKNK
jgi:hypothetical protein